MPVATISEMNAVVAEFDNACRILPDERGRHADPDRSELLGAALPAASGAARIGSSTSSRRSSRTARSGPTESHRSLLPHRPSRPPAFAGAASRRINSGCWTSKTCDRR